NNPGSRRNQPETSASSCDPLAIPLVDTILIDTAVPTSINRATSMSPLTTGVSSAIVSAIAVRAGAVQQDLVSVQCEPIRKCVIVGFEGTLHVEHPMAVLAAKMMVMWLASQFEPARLTGQVHRHKPVLVQQCPYVPVYRSDSESLHLRPRPGVHLRRGEWPVGVLEGPPDRTALSSVANHRFTPVICMIQ